MEQSHNLDKKPQMGQSNHSSAHYLSNEGSLESKPGCSCAQSGEMNPTLYLRTCLDKFMDIQWLHNDIQDKQVLIQLIPVRDKGCQAGGW